MGIFMGLAARFCRRMTLRHIAGVCVFALLACMPYGAGATSPTPASTPSSAPVPQAKAAGDEPAVATSKKEPGAAAPGKKTPGKKASGKKNSSAKKKQSAKSGSKPVAKAVAKPAAAKPQAAKMPEGGQKDEAPKIFPVSSVPKLTPAKAAKLPVADTWKPLMTRLAKDGVDQAYLRGMFGRLGDSYSHVPMGTKINELFTYKYTPKPPRKVTPAPKKSDTPPVYKWALKPENVGKCKEYLTLHKNAFAVLEKDYGIPKEVVAGLLMVETKLGTYLGASSSFWSLACLAASDTPERVDPTLQALPLPMTPDKMEWASKLLKERSLWAYKELFALIKHCKENDLDPLVMPGSVYGAIGICQFMPSNLPKFAVDGNKDGKIDLFDPADAIPSVGNYLKKHGWEGESRDVHHKVIKRYNKSNMYANTILALAEAIVAPPGDPAGASAVAVASAGADKKTAAGKKTSAAKSAKAAKPKKTSGKKPSSVKKASAGAKSGKAASAKAGSGQSGASQPAPAQPVAVPTPQAQPAS